MTLRENHGIFERCTKQEIACSNEIKAAGYDLQAIMTRAHEIRKASDDNLSFGEYLKMAWEEAKTNG
jgi:hypothetical protein